MSDKNGRPNHIEDALIRIKTSQWFGFKNLNGDDANKIYANLIIHDGSEKPTEKTITDKLKELQDAFDTAQTNLTNNKTSGKAKLKAGEALTDAEISALFGDN